MSFCFRISARTEAGACFDGISCIPWRISCDCSVFFCVSNFILISRDFLWMPRTPRLAKRQLPVIAFYLLRSSIDDWWLRLNRERLEFAPSTTILLSSTVGSWTCRFWRLPITFRCVLANTCCYLFERRFYVVAFCTKRGRTFYCCSEEPCVLLCSKICVCP